MAAGSFKEFNDKSIVFKQPADTEEWIKAKSALLSCPTNSIGVHPSPDFFKELPSGLPKLIDSNVYYLGYTSADSYGASSYLIVRPDGNVLVDSPRFHPWLVKSVEQLGGIKWMFLSHQDDVADHQKFHDHFGCQRIIHQADVNNGTQSCELILNGEEDYDLDNELKIVMTPGHTRGHMNLLYKERYLFTGDHLFVSEGKDLRASQSVNWFSWPQQVASLNKLLRLKFNWVLPGHGGWGYFDDGPTKLKDYLAQL